MFNSSYERVSIAVLSADFSIQTGNPLSLACAAFSGSNKYPKTDFSCKIPYCFPAQIEHAKQFYEVFELKILKNILVSADFIFILDLPLFIIMRELFPEFKSKVFKFETSFDLIYDTIFSASYNPGWRMICHSQYRVHVISDLILNTIRSTAMFEKINYGTGQ